MLFLIGRLFYTPGHVKLWESPRRAGGLLIIISRTCHENRFSLGRLIGANQKAHGSVKVLSLAQRFGGEYEVGRGM